MAESVDVFSSDMKAINMRKFLADLVLLYGFGLIGGVLIPHLTGTYIRGFFCDDESIRYTYKQDTVTPAVLLLYVFLVMIAVVAATETYRSKIDPPNSISQYRLGNTSIQPTVIRIINYIGYSQIGFVCLYVVTNLTKNCLGRLRPNFLDVCKPLNITCQGHEYYDNYVCSGNPEMVAEARRSFFSGHSSFAMYASTFAAIYLYARIPRHTLCRTALPIIQTTLLGIGLLISYSRINDHKHHWSDVIIGILAGVGTAVYTCVVWAQMFTKPTEEVLPIHNMHTGYTDVTTGIPANTNQDYGNSRER